MTTPNPFAAAFDAYWKWPLVGSLYTAANIDLPQLEYLGEIFPDAQRIRLIELGNYIRFKDPTLGPSGSVVDVHLVSPPITSIATGDTLRMHIYPVVAPHPVCCGLFTSTHGKEIYVAVPVDDLKKGPVTLERLQAYDKKRS